MFPRGPDRFRLTRREAFHLAGCSNLRQCLEAYSSSQASRPALVLASGHPRCHLSGDGSFGRSVNGVPGRSLFGERKAAV